MERHIAGLNRHLLLNRPISLLNLTKVLNSNSWHWIDHPFVCVLYIYIELRVIKIKIFLYFMYKMVRIRICENVLNPYSWILVQSQFPFNIFIKEAETDMVDEGTIENTGAKVENNVENMDDVPFSALLKILKMKVLTHL